jgi:hypothetical protein
VKCIWVSNQLTRYLPDIDKVNLQNEVKTRIIHCMNDFSDAKVGDKSL